MNSSFAGLVRLATSVAVLALFSAPLLAQSADGPINDSTPTMQGSADPDSSWRNDGIDAQSSFGTQDQAVTTVNWTAFRPRHSGATFEASFFTGVWVTTPGDYLYAPLPQSIPQGAIIEQIVFYCFDSSATAAFTGRLSRFWTPSNVGGTPSADTPFSVSTDGAGTPGGTIAFATADIPVIYRGDLDGVGDTDVASYHLSFTNGNATDGSVRLQQVRILWTRQVSPAPAFATFTDVPVGSPLHQYVEALVAAGITAGVGGGEYGVNAPITRGQMAVFLSKALGLHWPAY